MAVSIHHVYLQLVWVDSMGNVVHKDSTSTTLDDMRRAVTQEHRIQPNTSGPTSSTNSADWPTIREYLDAEAADDFAIAYMDQFQLITQMIT